MSGIRNGFDLEAVLIGGHTNASSYSGVHVRFDVLNGWANPEPLTRELEDGRTVLTVDPTTLTETRWRDWIIRLREYPEGRWGPDVHLDQQVQMEIEGPPTGLRELMDGPMRALQDLFVVMVGDPVVITELFVRPNDPAWTEHQPQTYFHTRQPEPSQRVGPSRFRNCTAERWSCSMIPGSASSISYRLGSISTSLGATGSNCCVPLCLHRSCTSIAGTRSCSRQSSASRSTASGVKNCPPASTMRELPR